MNVQRGARNSAAAVAAALLIGAGASSPVFAAQVPYTCQIVIGMEFTQGARKITILVDCANPGELVRIDIVANVPASAGAAPSSQTRQLAMLRADSQGVARGSVALPSDLACDATIKATGMESKRTAYSDLHIEPCNESDVASSQAKGPGDDPSGAGGSTEQIWLASAGERIESSSTESDLAGAHEAAGAGGVTAGAATAGLGLILAAGAAGAIALRRREGRTGY